MSIDLKRKALTGVVWMLTQKFGGHISNLVVFVILARLLDAREFGVMSMAQVVILFLSVFASQGLTSAIIQRENLDDSYLSTAFWLNLFVGCVTCGISIAIAPLVANLYKVEELTIILTVLSANIIFESLTSVQNSILQRKLEYKSIAYRELAAEFSAGALGVFMALSGYGVWSLVVRSICRLVIQIAVFWAVTPWRPRWHFSFWQARDILGYGSSVLGVNVLNFAARQLDNFLIGIFFSASVLGEYNIAKRLVQIAVDLVRSAIGGVAWSMFSRIQNDRLRLRSAMLQVNHLVTIVVLPMFLALSFYASIYIPVLFGEKWSASVPLAQILAIVGLFESLRSSHESLILAVGQANKRLKLAFMVAVANVGAFFLVYSEGLLFICLSYAVVALMLFPFWSITISRLLALPGRSYLVSFRDGGMATVLILFLHFTLESVFHSIGIEYRLVVGFEVLILASVYFVAIHRLAPQLARNIRDLRGARIQ